MAYLTPHQHGAKDDLQTVKEVVPNEDDWGAATRPALTGADGLDTGGRCEDTRRGGHRGRLYIASSWNISEKLFENLIFQEIYFF